MKTRARTCGSAAWRGASRNGEGVAQDAAEAVRWYRKAAEQGYAKAQYNFGVMYYKGDGVAQDKAEAARWYRKAVEQGFAPAKKALERMNMIDQ